METYKKYSGMLIHGTLRTTEAKGAKYWMYLFEGVREDIVAFYCFNDLKLKESTFYTFVAGDLEKNDYPKIVYVESKENAAINRENTRSNNVTSTSFGALTPETSTASTSSSGTKRKPTAVAKPTPRATGKRARKTETYIEQAPEIPEESNGELDDDMFTQLFGNSPS